MTRESLATCISNRHSCCPICGQCDQCGHCKCDPVQANAAWQARGRWWDRREDDESTTTEQDYSAAIASWDDHGQR